MGCVILGKKMIKKSANFHELALVANCVLDAL
jgi:hypothetical protein